MKEMSYNDWSKARDVIEKLTAYLALASSLGKDSSIGDYRAANALSWQLAVMLPESLYRQVNTAISSPTEEVNILTVVAEAGKVFFKGYAGTVPPDNMMWHAPDAAKELEKAKSANAVMANVLNAARNPKDDKKR